MPAGVSLGGGAHGGGHDLALCHLPLLHTARLQYVEHLGASTLVEEAVREEALAPLLAAASPRTVIVSKGVLRRQVESVLVTRPGVAAPVLILGTVSPQRQGDTEGDENQGACTVLLRII